MDASLKMRILTAVIGLPIIILILLGPTPLVVAMVMAASVIGLYEFFGAVSLKEHKLLCAAGYLAAVVIPLGGYLTASVIQGLIYAYILLMFIIMLASHKKIGFKDIALLIMGLIYIPYFLSHIIYIRDMELGRVYIWLVFLGAFMTDTCAFFTGKAIGGKKLCPNISPKKTVAGAVGGVIGCGISFIIFGIIINIGFAGYVGENSLNLVLLFVLGLISAVISEIGDLAASIIKRQYNIKDFGTLLPGHGGILDRCDSIIMVAPIIFLFLTHIGL